MDDRFFRSAWPTVYAAAVRCSGGDFSLAEDATATAFERATQRWSQTAPENPVGWLITVARRAVIDDGRRQATIKRHTIDVGKPLTESHVPTLGDDVLELFFTCAHPSLAPASQVALILRSVGGLRPHEIARAFHVPLTTMEKRLVRARTKIREAAIPFRVPSPNQLNDRLDAVLRAILLIFNEGYAPTSGVEAFRQDLCDEAMYLARTLHQLLPEHPETNALVAITLFHNSRRYARFENGGLIPLRFQNRELWQKAEIGEAVEMTLFAMRAPQPGRYSATAAIAALHSEATSHETTDWLRIVELYEQLNAMEPSMSHQLGRAVAVLESHGPDIAELLFEAIEAPDQRARFLLSAARARSSELAGRPNHAIALLQAAVDDAPTPADRQSIDNWICRLERPTNR